MKILGKGFIFLFGLMSVFVFSKSSSDAQSLSSSSLNVPTDIAQTSASTGRRAAMTAAQNAIGVAAAVSGDVQIVAGPRQGPLKSGMPIFIGDHIKTGEASHAQILLKDETVFTLGANSGFKLDDFVYDGSTQSGRVTSEVFVGVFRFVTGKIARKKPENMEVRLPAGTIGIRGTIVGGRVEESNSLVMLLGPGRNNNTGDRQGEITVGNDVGSQRQSVRISRTGYGTRIEGPGIPPSPPVLIPPDIIQGLSNDLQPPANKQNADDSASQADAGAANDQAGQSTFGILGDMLNSNELADALANFDDQKNKQALDASESIVVVNDGITTLDQLRTIETGQFHFSGSGPLNIQGDETDVYSFITNLDFGARTVGGGASKVTGQHGSIDSHNVFSFDLLPQSFASGSGNAIFTHSGTTCTGGACDITVKYDLKNKNGEIASNADHSVSVVYNSTTYSGSGTASRCEGLGE